VPCRAVSEAGVCKCAVLDSNEFLKTQYSTLRESEGEAPSRLGENRNAVRDVRRGLAPCLKVSCLMRTKVKRFMKHDTRGAGTVLVL